MCNRWNQPGTVLHRLFFENSRAGEENQNKVADKEIDRRGKISNHTEPGADSHQPTAFSRKQEKTSPYINSAMHVFTW
jgi:hypothetical protein